MPSQSARAYRLRDLIPAGELAKALGVSVESVLDWRRRGGLSGYKIGKKVYFIEAEFMAWVLANLRIQS